MTVKNILYVWDADYPWDIRVEKICNTLQESGHKVHIAARNLKKNSIHEICDNGIHIHRIQIFGNDKLNYFLSFPLFFSPIWKRFLHNIIRSHNIELVIVRDLPLAIAGIWAGKKFNIPVILDMAEDYIAMIRDVWKARKYQGFNLIVRNPYLAKYVERYSFKNSDHILVVTEEAIEVVAHGGGDRNRVSIVSNTPQLDSFSRTSKPINGDIEHIRNNYSLIYTGGLQMGRGVQTVLGAIETMLPEIPDLLFVVVGDGYAAERLATMAKEIGVDKYVKWVGWVNHDNVIDYIRSCRIGVIPHLVTNHINTTIPNKIFDYMGCGIPVIASDAVPMKRIINNESCGRIFRSGNSDSLSQAVLDIYHSDIDYGNNGINAVAKKYNWEQDAGRLLKAVNKVRRQGRNT